MTQNRKRGRNTREDEVEFMPLSKRINNLHINGSLFLDNPNITSQPTQPNAAEWGPGPPCYPNVGSLPYNAPDTPPESVQNLNFNNVPQYNPVLNESQNPNYFYKNKLLFEMHIERMQRNGHNF